MQPTGTMLFQPLTPRAASARFLVFADFASGLCGLLSERAARRARAGVDVLSDQLVLVFAPRRSFRWQLQPAFRPDQRFVVPDIHEYLILNKV